MIELLAGLVELVLAKDFTKSLLLLLFVLFCDVFVMLLFVLVNMSGDDVVEDLLSLLLILFFFYI